MHALIIRRKETRYNSLWSAIWFMSGNQTGTHFPPGEPRALSLTSPVSINYSKHSYTLITFSLWLGKCVSVLRVNSLLSDKLKRLVLCNTRSKVIVISTIDVLTTYRREEFKHNFWRYLYRIDPSLVDYCPKRKSYPCFNTPV